MISSDDIEKYHAEWMISIFNAILSIRTDFPDTRAAVIISLPDDEGKESGIASSTEDCTEHASACRNHSFTSSSFSSTGRKISFNLPIVEYSSIRKGFGLASSTRLQNSWIIWMDIYVNLTEQNTEVYQSATLKNPYEDFVTQVLHSEEEPKTAPQVYENNTTQPANSWIHIERWTFENFPLKRTRFGREQLFTNLCLSLRLLAAYRCSLSTYSALYTLRCYRKAATSSTSKTVGSRGRTGEVHSIESNATSSGLVLKGQTPFASDTSERESIYFLTHKAEDSPILERESWSIQLNVINVESSYGNWKVSAQHNESFYCFVNKITELRDEDTGSNLEEQWKHSMIEDGQRESAKSIEIKGVLSFAPTGVEPPERNLNYMEGFETLSGGNSYVSQCTDASDTKTLLNSPFRIASKMKDRISSYSYSLFNKKSTSSFISSDEINEAVPPSADCTNTSKTSAYGFLTSAFQAIASHMNIESSSGIQGWKNVEATPPIECNTETVVVGHSGDTPSDEEEEIVNEGKPHKTESEGFDIFHDNLKRILITENFNEDGGDTMDHCDLDGNIFSDSVTPPARTPSELHRVPFTLGFPFSQTYADDLLQSLNVGKHESNGAHSIPCNSDKMKRLMEESLQMLNELRPPVAMEDFEEGAMRCISIETKRRECASFHQLKEVAETEEASIVDEVERFQRMSTAGIYKSVSTADNSEVHSKEKDAITEELIGYTGKLFRILDDAAPSFEKSFEPLELLQQKFKWNTTT